MDAARTADTGHTIARPVAVSAITEYPLEWLGVLVVALIDAVWAMRIGLSVTVDWLDFLSIAAILGAAVVLRLRFSDRGAVIAEYFVLTVVSASAFAVLSYLALTLSLPLADKNLLRFDRALGFDWLYWFHIVESHPLLRRAMYLVYASMLCQGIYFVALFGLLRNRARLREVFWIVFVASAITTLLCALMPALGTFDAFRLGDLGGYLGDIKRLRAGTNLHFEWAHLTGVVSFPSFHTTMALVYIYAFRNVGIVSVLIALLNILMLPAIPFIGGHYLADMLGGAAVAAIAIVAMRRLPLSEKSPA